MPKELTVRCKPFCNEPTHLHQLTLDTDGTIRVYDDIAGHYTVVHTLSERELNRIRRMFKVSP